MSNAQDTLNQMLGSAPSVNPVAPAPVTTSTQMMDNVLGVADSKQQSVMDAAAQKKAAIGGVQPQTLDTLDQNQLSQGVITQATGAGANSIPSELETDATYLPYQDLAAKYGDQAAQTLISNRNNARNSVDTNRSLSRTGAQATGDTILGVGQGLLNSVGGLAAFGTGLINNNAGVKVANAVQDGSNFLGSYESNSLKGVQVTNALDNALTGRDNKAQEQRDIDNGDSSFVAGLSRFGADFADAISNAAADPATLLDGTAQGVGSLLTAGPIGKGITTATRLAMPASMARIAAVGEKAAEAGHALPTTTAKAISAIGSKEAGTIAAIGLTEGGGAYQQTASQISQMSFADLKANSPDFNSLVQGGMSPEDARNEIANRAGLLAGAIQTPLAAGVGKLTAKFEANPFSHGSLTALAANSIKEPIEEGIQSASSQLISNYATKKYADKNQDILDGVGEQSGLGALYGLTSTGAVQGPTVLAGAPAAVIKAPLKAIGSMYSAVNDARQARTDAASPVSNDKVQTAATDLHQAAPEMATQAAEAINTSDTLSDADKAAAADYVNDVAGAMSVNHEAEIAASNDPVLIKAAGNPQTRVDLMLNLAKFMTDPANSEQDRLSIANAYDQQMGLSKQLLNEMPAALKDLPDDHPAKQFLDGVTKLNSIFEQTPAARDAGKAVGTIADNADKNGLLQPVDQSDLTSPAAQQNILNHMTVAQFAPAKANVDAVNTILKHATAGDIQTTPAQLTALKTTAALLDSAKQFDMQREAQGLTPQDIVGSQIKTDTSANTSKKSALQHVEDIRSAYNSGDLDTAAARLADFKKFAQHMNNKVVALNTHLETAVPNVNSSVKYDALMPDRTFKESQEGMFVNPRKGSTVEFAKRVGLEAQFVGDVVNSLSTAFPDLGVSHIEQTPLDPRLTTGSTKDVVSNFRNGVLKEGKLPSSPVEETAPVNDQSGTNETKNTAKVEEPTTPYNPHEAFPKADGWVNEVSHDGEFYRHTRTNESGSVSQIITDKDGNIKQENTTPAAVVEDTKGQKLQANLEEAFDKSNAKPDDTDLRNDYLKAQKSLDRHNDNLANEAARTQETDENFSDNEDTTTADASASKQIRSVYPNLVTVNNGNKFIESFNVPKDKPISRLTGLAFNEQTPISTVGSALQSREAFYEMSGTDVGNRLSKPLVQAYRDQMMYATKLAKGMDKVLADYVAKEKLTPEKLERLRLNTQTSGRLLNITEQDADGNISFNPELVEAAALASIQWSMKGNQFSPEVDVQTAASLYGVNQDKVTDEMINALSGFGRVDVGSTLGGMITRYWGVKSSPNAYLGYSQGIPTAMANEMLSQMVDAGIVDRTVVRYDRNAEQLLADGEAGQKDANGKASIVELGRYNIRELAENSPLKQFPDAIDKLVQTEPENTMYFNDAEIPVSKTQLHNPTVKNTAQQVKALQKMQDTKHYLNAPVLNFYGTIGKEGLVELFGEGDLSDRVLNKNHKQTLEGRNLSVASAFDQMSYMLAEMQSIAEDTGSNIEDVAIRYGYDMTRVNRAQMRGKQNPQSNKVMREAVLPTWSTVDLTDPDMKNNFMLAMAQALGEKIQNMSLDTAIANTTKQLTGPLAESVTMMQEFNKTGELSPSAITTLRNGFGGRKLAPVELQAISEYARYMNASPEELMSFKTPLYVEADGMVNGATNATQLLGSGKFTSTDIETAERGGLYFTPDTSTNEHRTTAKDSRDTYQTTADTTTKLLNDFKKRYDSENPAVSKLLGHLTNMMNVFLPDLSIADNGDILLKRGITKNPLTIKVYGSGLNGIAGNITDSVIDSIYEHMSTAADNMKRDPKLTLSEAMFGPNQDAKFQMYQSAMNALTSQVVGYNSKKYSHFVEDVSLPDNQSTSLIDYTVSPAEKKAIQQNMRMLFVDQMSDAISNTLGSTVLNNADLVGRVTDLKSIFAEAQFKKLVAEAIDKKVAENPDYRKSEFLTQKEVNAIRASVADLSPIINTGTQNFDVSSQNSSAVAGTEVSRNMDGTSRSPLIVNGVGTTGVSGIAFMNIGMGDGQMMQSIYTNPETDDRTLPVFDGQHLALDRIQAGSAIANQAVADTWKGNTMRALSESWNKIVPHLDSSFPEESRKQVIRVLQAIYQDNTIESDADVKSALADIAPRLERVADSIDARHATYAEITHSIDQMAGGATPYVNLGTSITGTSQQRADALNAIYAKHFKVKPTVQAEPSTVLSGYGNKLQSGVSVLSQGDISKMLSGVFPSLAPNEKRLVLALKGTKNLDGYSLVHGTREQLASWDADNGSTYGLDAFSNPQGKGFISFNGKQIVIMSPTTETVLHELVHAATFETVLNATNGSANKDVTAAVQNVEGLLEQFKTLPTTKMDVDSFNAYQSALATINNIQSDPTLSPEMVRAQSVNELMAWGLSNKALSKELNNTQSRLGQMVSQIIDSIKSLFTKFLGTSVATTNSMLEQLEFSTAVIAKSQPSAAQALNETKLMHSAAYGSNERLVEVNKSFDKLIGDYLGSNLGHLDEAKRRTKIDNALQLGSTLAASAKVGHIFPMSMQEASTYSLVVSALATEAAIDPSALSRVDDLYKHVVKNLTPEMLMPENPADPIVAESIAQYQHSFLMGTEASFKDENGRSSFLSSFLALSITNDTVREALAKLKVPKDALDQSGTFDAAVENIGTNMMDALSRRMSGEGKQANVRDAIDALTDRIMDTADNRQGFYDQYVNPVGNAVDSANDVIVNLLDTGSTKLIAAADKVGKATNNKAVKTAASVLKVLGAMATEKNGEHVAQGIMQELNRTRAFQPMFDIINDIVGRTTSNAVVYDVIKTVRALSQQIRQQYRERLPTTIAGKFSRELSSNEWATLHQAMGKTDLASLRSNMSQAEVLNVLSHPAELSKKITNLESSIRSADPAYWNSYEAKMKQLANFMMTGQPGKRLLRNAHAISQGWFEKVPNTPRKVQDEAFTQNVDHLVSLYALQSMDLKQRLDVAKLADSESEGMGFALSYLMGQRKDEVTKANMSEAALANHYKGYIPAEQQQGVSLIVAKDSDYSRLANMSYVRVGDYVGSSHEKTGTNKGYYFASAESRAAFNQGIMQNVRQTAGGVDSRTGFTSYAMVAGRITDFLDVKEAEKNTRRDEKGTNLLPVFDGAGKVVAFERSLDPAQTARLNVDQNLAKQIGVWRGRQVEEAQSQQLNDGLVYRLRDMYTKDLAQNPTAQDTYINIFDARELAKDKVLADAVSLITPQTKATIEKVFGSDFYVRRDMLNDVFGYRSASVGDAWTGNSRWSDATHKVVRDAALTMFGNKAYQYAVNSQKFLQNVVANARSIIIVKSVVVPMTNAIGNFYQLAGRGVPLRDIVKGTPRKLAEINAYTKARVRHIEAEAELRSAEANNNAAAKRRLNTEIQAITDGYKRLSIYPLLAAGEFSAINDNTLAEDIDLTSGKLLPYIESQINKLPKELQTAGRWALVTKDTPLFKALEKSVEYGDFLSKAILYDDLTKRLKLSPEQALARVSEEYVNYDRLPGRTRGALEKNGLMWFYNFKLRSTKVALSMIRNNPVNALLSGMAPTPTLFGTIGSPITDNFVTMLADGNLGHSLGVGQAFHAPMLNPWVNLLK